MALPTVHISKGAFFIMIYAATNVFKKECYGFVLGYKPSAGSNRYLVTDAAPFQNLKRQLNTEIELKERSSRRFKKFLFEMKNIYPKYLGEFHSHPEWGDLKPSDKMSETDEKEFNRFTRYGAELEFIISISSRKKGKLLWEALSDGDIRGSFGKCNLTFTVYTLIDGEKEGEKIPQRLQIVAPRAVESLNRIA